MNDMRAQIMEALMRMMQQRRMPPAAPEMQHGVNVSPVPPMMNQPRPPAPPSGGVRG